MNNDNEGMIDMKLQKNANIFESLSIKKFKGVFHINHQSNYNDLRGKTPGVASQRPIY